MSEEEQSVKKEQVAEAQVENKQTQEAPKEPEVKESEDTFQQRNFANLRKAKETLEQENDQLKRTLEEIQRRLSPKQPETEPDDGLSDLADDDILTAAQARKLAEKTAKKVLEETRKAQEKQMYPQTAKSKYPDMDEVLTQENLKEFEQNNPVMAQVIYEAGQMGKINPYEAAYQAIKNSPQYQSKSAKKAVEKDSKTLQENLSKPVSSNAIGKGGLSGANTFANMDRTDLYKEMMYFANKG